MGAFLYVWFSADYLTRFSEDTLSLVKNLTPPIRRARMAQETIDPDE